MPQSGNPPRSGPSSPQPDDGVPTHTIPVVREEASVSHVLENTGGAVRVRIVTQEERQKLPLTEVIEEVAVERVPVNRYVSERSGPREEGDVVIIPVFEIVPVVEERLLLKEEVHLHRRRREVRHEAEMVLRTETPIVERRMPGQEEWNEDHPDR